MRKIIISSLAVLLAVSVYAQEVTEDKEVASDETVSVETTDSLYQSADCGCGGKIKK